METNYEESQPQKSLQGTQSEGIQRDATINANLSLPKTVSSHREGQSNSQQRIQPSQQPRIQTSPVKTQPMMAKIVPLMAEEGSQDYCHNLDSPVHEESPQGRSFNPSYQHTQNESPLHHQKSSGSSPLMSKHTSSQLGLIRQAPAKLEVAEEGTHQETMRTTSPGLSSQKSYTRPVPKTAQIKPLVENNEYQGYAKHDDNSGLKTQESEPIPHQLEGSLSQSKPDPREAKYVPNEMPEQANSMSNVELDKNWSVDQSHVNQSQQPRLQATTSHQARTTPSLRSNNSTRVPTDSPGEGKIGQEHSKLLPFRSSDLQELADLIVSLSQSETNWELLRAILSKGVFIIKSSLLEIPDEEASQMLNIQEEWFQYYLKQFLMYSIESDYYEPWEMLVMALFNSDNKIVKLPHMPPLSSERFEDRNPCKILLDLAGGQLRKDNMFFLVLCYSIAKDCFHPQALSTLIEDYLRFIESEESFWSRLAVLMTLFPQAILILMVRHKLQRSINNDWDLFACLTELSIRRVAWDGSNLHTALWFAIHLCELCLRRGLIESAEEYIKFITSNRTSSEVATDPAFTQEFRRVRSVYFESFEKNKQNGGKGGSAIDQMFGFMKGIVNSTVTKAKDSTAASSQEVQWDPVTKRWLINGKIPPDHEAEEREKEMNRPSGPPPIKKLPPPTSQAPSTGKRTGLSQKQKFVAYQIGNQ